MSAICFIMWQPPHQKFFGSRNTESWKRKKKLFVKNVKEFVLECLHESTSMSSANSLCISYVAVYSQNQNGDG